MFGICINMLLTIEQHVSLWCARGCHTSESPMLPEPHAVSVDLSKYFDTLNHKLLMNLVREQIHDKCVLRLIKKYPKSGVMENGIVVKAEEGLLQGGPKQKLKMNADKSKITSVLARKHFKFLGFISATTT